MSRVRSRHSTPQIPVRGLIEPTAEARYRIQLNASAALKAKLELLQALTSHSNPSGDLAKVIERAVDLAIEEAQRKRFAKTEQPRKPGSSRLVKGMRSLTRRGHIPNATRREVIARACACGAPGKRGCAARGAAAERAGSQRDVSARGQPQKLPARLASPVPLVLRALPLPLVRPSLLPLPASPARSRARSPPRWLLRA